MTSVSPLDAYLTHLTVERRLARNSVEGYARDLSGLADFAARQGRSVEALTRADLEGLRARPDGRGALAALGRARRRLLPRLLPLSRHRRTSHGEPRRRSAAAAGVEGAAALPRGRGRRPAHRAARRHHAARPARPRADRAAVRDRHARLGAALAAARRRESRSVVSHLHRKGQQTAHRPDRRRGGRLGEEVHPGVSAGAAGQADEPAPVRQRAAAADPG